MAQAGGAAEANKDRNVKRLGSVRVDDTVGGPLRQLELGLDDDRHFCVRVVELVQISQR